MKRTILIIAILVLTGLLATGCGGAKVNELDARVTTLESNLATKTDETINLQNQLGEKDQEISNLNATLSTQEGQINDLNSQINTKDAEINDLNDKLTASDSQITDLSSQVNALESQVADLQAQIPQLRDPTYEEVVVFISADKTNEEIPGDYALAAMLTAENAATKGIKAYWVIAKLGNIGYNFIGFNTTDKGWVYFAANSDFEVVLVEGEEYDKINNFPEFPFNDTIESMHYLPIP